MIKNGDLPAMPVWCDNSDQIARYAISHADALLAELERTKGEVK